MRIALICVLSLAINFSASCQDQIFDLVKNEDCECLKKLDVSKSSIEQLKTCMLSAIQNNIQLIYDKAIAGKYPDSLIYQKSLEYGQSLGKRLDTALIYACDPYFKICDSLRIDQFRIKNRDSVQKILDKITALDAKDQAPLLEQKARANFLLGNYEEAYVNSEAILRGNEQNVVALVIHGHRLETGKKYKEAALVDYTLNQITGQSLYLVWAAINNRKSAELKQ